MLQAYFQSRDFMPLRQAALAAGVAEEDWRKFLAYASGVYGNMGNYHAFGFAKFVPEISSQVFKTILISNPLYGDPDAFYRVVIDELYPQVESEMFAYDDTCKQLNFPFEGGVTGYFGRNLSQEDLDLVSEFLGDQKLSLLNTRAFKENGKFVITVGSVSKELTRKEIEFKGHKFDLNYGEFAPYLEECNHYLTEASKYCANETQ